MEASTANRKEQADPQCEGADKFFACSDLAHRRIRPLSTSSPNKILPVLINT